MNQSTTIKSKIGAAQNALLNKNKPKPESKQRLRSYFSYCECGGVSVPSGNFGVSVLCRCTKCDEFSVIHVSEDDFADAHGRPVSDPVIQMFLGDLKKGVSERINEKIKKIRQSEIHFKELKARQERKQKYAEELASPHWQRLRLKVLKRDNHLCQSCLIREATDVHHRDYRFRGNEPAFDLISLCSHCHENIHNMLAKKPFEYLH